MQNLELIPIDDLIEELSNRCHDGCVIVCCYRDDGMVPKNGKTPIMTNCTGFANNNEVLFIMSKLINRLVTDCKRD
jgi:hypothetical protein